MMHLLCKYDVAPPRFAMMRCLPLCARRHTSLGEAVIIGAANIICRRQTSFKKRTFVLVDKSAFFVGGGCEIRTHAPVKANGFQDRLVMTTSITLREYDATACIIFTELLRCGSANFVRRIHFAYPTRRCDATVHIYLFDLVIISQPREKVKSFSRGFFFHCYL